MPGGRSRIDHDPARQIPTVEQRPEFLLGLGPAPLGNGDGESQDGKETTEHPPIAAETALRLKDGSLPPSQFGAPTPTLLGGI